MSVGWQAHIDTGLINHNPKCVSKAAIHGRDGTLWATTPGLEVTERLGTRASFPLYLSDEQFALLNKKGGVPQALISFSSR